MPNAYTAHDLESSAWANPNPSKCPCHGSGWMLSDFDSWHLCRIHGAGVPHPESADREGFDFSAHLHAVYIKAYTYFRDMARDAGFRGHFKNTCTVLRPSTPKAWVNAAEDICDAVLRRTADDKALAAGFSCALEQRWDQDGRDEAAGWGD